MHCEALIVGVVLSENINFVLVVVKATLNCLFYTCTYIVRNIKLLVAWVGSLTVQAIFSIFVNLNHKKANEIYAP